MEMENKISFKRSFGSQKNLPNPVMVARQIDDLRDVLRRMKATQSQTFDAFTNQKVQGLHSN